MIIHPAAYDAWIRWAVGVVELESRRKIEDFLVAGAFPRELGIEHEPPLVEVLPGGGVVVHERMRFI